MNIHQVLAAAGFLVCLALLVHSLLGARHQARLRLWWTVRDAQVRQWWARRVKQRRIALAGRPADLAQRRRSGKAHSPDRDAAKEAADLIERARRHAATRHGDPGEGPGKAGGQGGEDNVVRPRRFGNRPNDLH